jgi:hypothetical protein
MQKGQSLNTTIYGKLSAPAADLGIWTKPCKCLQALSDLNTFATIGHPALRSKVTAKHNDSPELKLELNVPILEPCPEDPVGLMQRNIYHIAVYMLVPF